MNEFVLEMIYVGILGLVVIIPLSIIVYKYRDDKIKCIPAKGGLFFISFAVTLFEVIWLCHALNIPV